MTESNISDSVSTCWAEKLDQTLDLKVEYLEEVSRMKEDCCVGKKIVLFGAGATSNYIIECFRNYGINPYCFCDNSPERAGLAWGGVKVYSLQTILEDKRNTLFYITTQLYYTDIRRQLLDAGIEEDMISDYDVIPQFEWEVRIAENLRQDRDGLIQLLHDLSDDTSKEVLLDRIAFLITRRREYAVHARSLGDGTQYFDDTVFSDWGKITSMVDCGAYIGDSAIALLEKKPSEGCRFYELEPDPELMEKTRESLNNIQNVIYIEKATSDSAGQMRVSSSLGVMQSIAVGDLFLADNVDEKTVFEVCTLDEELKDREVPISLIKMDIEGAELASLRGAEKVIREDHPMLAICVYHKKEDLLSISAWIKRIWSKYRLYLRHYSDNQTETVLYALP